MAHRVRIPEAPMTATGRRARRLGRIDPRIRNLSALTLILAVVAAAIGLPALAGAYDAPTSPSQAYYVYTNWSDLVSFNGAPHTYAYVLGYTAAEGAPTEWSTITLDFGRQRYSSTDGWEVCTSKAACSTATDRTDSWVEAVAEQFEDGYNDGHSAVADIVIGTSNDDYLLCNNVTGQVDPNWQAAGTAWASVVQAVQSAPQPTLAITLSGNDLESWTDAYGAAQGTPTWQACGAGASSWYAGLQTATPIGNFDFGNEAAYVQPTAWTQQQLYEVAQGNSGALALPEIYCDPNGTQWLTPRASNYMQFSGVTSENGTGACTYGANGTPTPDLSWSQSDNVLNDDLTQVPTPAYADNVFSDSSSFGLAQPTEAPTLTPTATPTPTP
jgi:hypothetical protein